MATTRHNQPVGLSMRRHQWTPIASIPWRVRSLPHRRAEALSACWAPPVSAASWRQRWLMKPKRRKKSRKSASPAARRRKASARGKSRMAHRVATARSVKTGNASRPPASRHALRPRSASMASAPAQPRRRVAKSAASKILSASTTTASAGRTRTSASILAVVQPTTFSAKPTTRPNAVWKPISAMPITFA